MKCRPWFCLLVMTLLSRATGWAQATLNFDDLALANYAPIPASYGDGLDPNVSDVRYRTFHADTDATLNPFLEFWQADYGDLLNVAYAEADGYAAEIRFEPAEGFGVRLIGFDLASYPRVDRALTMLRIVDGNGQVLLDLFAAGSTSVEGAGSPAHSSFLVNVVHGGPLAIQWGVDWNIGIDNITFEALPLSAIPEPASTTLAAALMALAAGLRWQRRAGPRAGATR